jgi:glycosyltransferase involved in cell wall biosynthesis
MDKMKICIISEGSYPIVRGGVSEWTQQLIKGLPSLDFDIFCLAPTGQETWISEYDKPPNVKGVTIHGVTQSIPFKQRSLLPKVISQEMCNCVGGVLDGRVIDCERLVRLMEGAHPITKAWLGSREYWDYLVQYYDGNYAESEFSEFFWTLNGIFSSFLDTMDLAKQLPKDDIYHPLTTGMAGVLGVLAKLMYRKPLVVSEHGLYLKERVFDLAKHDISLVVRQQTLAYYQSLVKTCYEYADFILPVCQDHADQQIKLGADAKKIRVIVNGVDSEKFKPSIKHNSHAPMVGCFARVVPIKDQLTLIQASKRILEKHDADFIFAGEIQDAEYYHECQTLVEQLGLGNNIKFIGHSDNMQDWYRQADIFVLSSKSEGVPLALLEAMSCGLPSVCTGVGGIPDILRDNVTGYLVTPGDFQLMATKISVLLEDKILREKMGLKARTTITENFTIEQMSQKILGIYREAHGKEKPTDGSS